MSTPWTESDLEAIWEKGTPVEGLDEDEFRMDTAGALMQRDALDKRHRFGWVVDAVSVHGGTDADLSNLRPLFWKNGAARHQPLPRRFFRYHGALELNVNHFELNDI